MSKVKMVKNNFNTGLTSLKNIWFKIPGTIKFIFLVLIIILPVGILLFSPELKIYKGLSNLEIILVNIVIYASLLSFIFTFSLVISSSINKKRTISLMGYEKEYLEEPKLFGKIDFQMVNKLNNGMRYMTIYSSNYGFIKIKDMLEEIERELDCEYCEENGKKDLYIVLEGYARVFFGFTIRKNIITKKSLL